MEEKISSRLFSGQGVVVLGKAQEFQLCGPLHTQFQMAPQASQSMHKLLQDVQEITSSFSRKKESLYVQSAVD